MHILQPKHSKIRSEEASELLEKLNISRSQLPRIKKTDAVLPQDAEIGDIVKIERKEDKGKVAVYYRVVVP